MKRLVTIWAVASVVVALAAPPSLLAQAAVPVRQMLVKWSSAAPLLSFSARDFADRKVMKKLKSGLPQMITTRVYAYRNGDQRRPISASAISCRIVYDLWEDTYHVQLQTASRDRAKVSTQVSNVIRSCLDVKKLAVGQGAAFKKHRGKEVYFAAIIELNPMSPDTVQRIRRWLARPGGDQLEGDAFFGSFVSIFVSRRLGVAEKSLSFRSRAFIVPQ